MQQFNKKIKKKREKLQKIKDNVTIDRLKDLNLTIKVIDQLLTKYPNQKTNYPDIFLEEYEFLKNYKFLWEICTTISEFTSDEMRSYYWYEHNLKNNAAKLHELGIPNVVITYGDKGSYISTSKIEKLVPPFKVQATDTTGAGDTFIGYLASKLKNDFSNIEQAAIFASRASSIAVQRLGAQPSIPTVNEVNELMESK